MKNIKKKDQKEIVKCLYNILSEVENLGEENLTTHKPPTKEQLYICWDVINICEILFHINPVDEDLSTVLELL